MSALRPRYPLHHWLHKERQRLIMLLLGALVGMEFLENGMFVFASSHILGGVGAAPQEFAQVQAAYAIGSMLMIALQQWLTRHFGYRRYLLLALLLFGLGDMASALADTIGQLTAARLVQGMGGGAFFLSTRVLIPLLFAPALRPVASRYFMLSIFSVGVIAPVTAAWAVEEWGWRFVFWSVLPLIPLLAVGVRLLMPPQLGKSSERVRWSLAPLLLFALAVGCVQWGFSEARYELFDRPEMLALIVFAGLALLGLFGIHQWKHDEPLLHLRDLTHPGFLAGMALYALYYFIANFSNYLFPQFAEQAMGLSLATAGWLNAFAGLVSLLAAVVYLRHSAKVLDKRPLMMAGCLVMAASAAWLALLPPDARFLSLLWPLAIKGLFGVMMVLPVAGLTWRALDARHFAKGYQSKNLMRQLVGSFASAVAAIALADGRFALYGDLASRITPDRPAAMHWLATVQAQFEHMGLAAAQAHGAALAQMSAVVSQQALFMACQQLYLWVAVVALAAGVIVMVQKKLM